MLINLHFQLVQRISILFMPQKYQPDYKYLRHVPIKKVHLFTGIQLMCLIVLWVIKSIKKISIIFPLMVSIIIQMEYSSKRFKKKGSYQKILKIHRNLE